MQLKICALLLALAGSLLSTYSYAQALPSSGVISAGSSHAVAVRADGRVFGWGNNANGRLGIGSTTQKLSPTLLSGITNVSAISAGGSHTVALKTNGTVWAWGLNTSGQIGDNSTTQRTSPVQINTLTSVIAVAAGSAHTLALRQDGTVWAWGLNSDGRLGDNSTTQRLVPVQVSGISGVISIAAGSTYSLALKSDGTVWAWGDNTNGRLGDGTATQRLIPHQVNGITQIIAISAGASFGLALKSDGTVWAWGDNVNGTLGDNTNTQRLTPVQVNSVTSVTAIAAGSTHALALKADGCVYSWGLNANGRLGDGSLVNRLSPVLLSGISGILQVGVGADYSLAIASDGRVFSWGENASGQLGFGGTLPRKAPTQIYTVYPITKLAVRSGVGGAIQAGGKVYLWGRNTNGQLGTGDQIASRVPFIHPNIGTLVDISFGATHTLAVKSDGSVWSWGDNTNGRLGNGTTASSLVPTQVSNLSGITRVAAGGTHSLALKSDGTVWSWGDNTNGRLGDGTTTQRLVPVQVSSLTGVIAIGAGDAHSVALKSDGTARAWGLNTNGRLGDGTTTQRLLPVQVSGLTSISSISIGGSHNLARRSDGSVWVWGNNASGRLGDGTTAQKTTAVQLAGFTGVLRLAAGSAHSLAVKSDGSVWAWGSNTSGQLGDGTITNRTSPVQVPGLFDVADVAAGEDNSFALTTKATVWGWGLNISGSLGINEPVFSQAAAIRLIANASDSDGDGLSDAWEISNLGGMASSGSSDTDADGLSDAQEFLLSTAPAIADQDQDFLTDIADPQPINFFNGLTPSLVALSGDGQLAPPLSTNLHPFEVAVWNSDASFPLVNAPLTFSVTSGGGLLLATSSPEAVASSTLQLRVDADGTSRAYYRQPGSDQVFSYIEAASGGLAVNFTTGSQASPDSDHDGLSDAQETALGTSSLMVDTDSDGITDELEVRLGLNPLTADADQVPVAIGGRRIHLRSDLGVTATSSYVTTWADQSGRGNHAVVADTPYRPRQFANIVNGKPVIRFDGTDDYLQLPNAMSGATAAEMFLVSKTTVRVGNDESVFQLSPGGATSLPGSSGWLFDGFGSTTTQESGVTAARVSAFNLYNASAKPGEWRNSINGMPLSFNRTNQVAFLSAPTIGMGGGYFKGDVAELIVFDHILTGQERAAMTLYLSNRYTISPNASAPSSLSAVSINPSQASLRWTGVAPFTSALTYIIERRLGTEEYIIVAEISSALSYIDSGLTPGATYEYRVRAAGLNGVRSGYSNTYSLTMLIGNEPVVPMSDMKLWLKADAGITDSGSLSTWADQSRNGNHATAIDAQFKPLLVNNVVNGRPVVRFDGANDSLHLPYGALSGVDAGELFVVSRSTSRTGYSEPVISIGAGGAAMLSDVDGLARDGFGSAYQHEVALNTAALQSFNIYNASSSPGVWRSWFNGGLASKSSDNVVNFGSGGVVGSDDTSFYKGDIAEVIVFARPLSDAERSVVTRYLGAKYALGSAPPQPGGLVASSVSHTQVHLRWDSVQAGDFSVWYTVERAGSDGVFSVLSELTNAKDFIDSSVVPGQNYSYRVKSRSVAGVFSTYSNVAFVEVPAAGTVVPFSSTRLWLKADTGAIGNAKLVGWIDQSPSQNFAPGLDPLARPSVVSNIVNGRPVIRFDGIDDALDLVPSILSGVVSAEVFIVSKSNYIEGTSRPVFSFGSAGATYLPDSDGLLRDGFASTTQREVLVSTSVLSSFNIYGASSSAASWRNFLNGTPLIDEANSVSTSGNGGVGKDSFGLYFGGDIAELIVFDRSLTSSERIGVHDYLAKKYGLTALLPLPPAAPSLLAAESVEPGKIALTWQLSGSGFGVIYEIERKEGVGAFEMIAETQLTAFEDMTVVPGNDYKYRVRARNHLGHSQFSDSVDVFAGVLTISNLPDVTVNRNSSTGILTFVINGQEGLVQNVSVSVGSSNLAIVPTSNIVLSSSGPYWSLNVTPATGAFGEAIITVSVTDGQSYANESFVLTVENIPGELTAEWQQVSVFKNKSLSVTLNGSSPNGGTLSYQVIQAPTAGQLTGVPPNLVFTPSTGFVGADSFLFSVSDGSSTSDPALINISVREGLMVVNPTPSDSDGDGMPNSWELSHQLDVSDPDDALLDADSDGLLNYDEYTNGTDPRTSDSDGDGESDKIEIENGGDPLDPGRQSIPLFIAIPVTEVPWADAPPITYHALWLPNVYPGPSYGAYGYFSWRTPFGADTNAPFANGPLEGDWRPYIPSSWQRLLAPPDYTADINYGERLVDAKGVIYGRARGFLYANRIPESFATRWVQSGYQNIGPSGHWASAVVAVNPRGNAIIEGFPHAPFHPEFRQEGFVWTEELGTIKLPDLGVENLNIQPTAIDINGQVLGSVGGTDVLWRPRGSGYQAIDLNIYSRGQVWLNSNTGRLYTWSATETFELAPVKISISADFDRDGLIDTSPAASAQKMVRFWINDDNDASDAEGDDIPGTTAPGSLQLNCTVNLSTGRGVVDGARDLVDFFPVYLDLKQILSVVPPGPTVKYKIKHAEGALNFVYTQSTPITAFNYQTNLVTTGYGNDDKNAAFDKAPSEATTWHITAEGHELSTTFLNLIIHNDGGIILVEGYQATEEPLIVSIEKDGVVVAERKLNLKISSVEEMYRHKNLLYTDQAGQHTAVARIDYGVVGASHAGEPSNWPDSLTNGKSLVFLHGYNVNPQEARGWAAEAFKRFHWSKSKAKFYAVTWPGAETQIGTLTPNYHANVINAFAAADDLSEFVTEIRPSGEVVAVGHSLGNIVIASAIHDWSAPLSTHAAVNAVLAIESLDAGAPENLPNMAHPDWVPYSQYTWATEWYKLFIGRNPVDRRSELTWRGRFQNVIPKIVNFYSSGEDVLDNALDEEPSFDDAATSGVGRFTWALQEKLKGRLITNLALGSNYGGWKFSSTWGPRFPSVVNSTPNYVLMSDPFFDHGPAELSFLYDPDNTSQSYRVPEAFFTSNYNGYNANRLLAQMFPSLTFVAGRNQVQRINDFASGRQFNMNSTAFKPNGWPASLSGRDFPNWHHSDLRNVAYLYIYPVFDQILTVGGLK